LQVLQWFLGIWLIQFFIILGAGDATNKSLIIETKLLLIFIAASLNVASKNRRVISFVTMVAIEVLAISLRG